MFRRAVSLLVCFFVLLLTALGGRNSQAQQKPLANADPPANLAQNRTISFSADFLSGSVDPAQDYVHDVIRSGKRIRIYKTPYSFSFNSKDASYFLNNLHFNVYLGNSEDAPAEYNLIPIVKGEHNPFSEYAFTLSGRSDGSAVYGTVSAFKGNLDAGWKGLMATLEVTGGSGIFKGATGTIQVTGETVIDGKTKRFNLVGHASGTITVAAQNVPAPMPSSLTVYLGGAGQNDPYIPDQIADLRRVGVKNVVEGKKTFSTTLLKSYGHYADLLTAIKIRELPQSVSLNEIEVADDGKSQLNFIGYSYGSMLAAECAMTYAKKGRKINFLVLVGSPIDTKFLAALKKEPNISRVMVVDLTKYGDPIYAGMSDYDVTAIVVGIAWFGNLVDVLGDREKAEGHYYYAPDNEIGRKHRLELAQELYEEGLR